MNVHSITSITSRTPAGVCLGLGGGYQGQDAISRVAIWSSGFEPSEVLRSPVGWLFLLVIVALSFFGVRSLTKRFRNPIDSGNRGEPSDVCPTELVDRFLRGSHTVAYSMTIEDGVPNLAWVSRNVDALFGASQEEVLSAAWWNDHLDPGDRSRVLDRILDRGAHGRVVLENRFHLDDQRVVWVRDVIEAERDPEGGVSSVVGSWTDITAEKEAEQRCRETEDRYRKLFDHVSDVIVTYDKDLRILQVNGATERITGRVPADFVGRRDEEVLPPEICRRYLPTLREALSSGETRSVELDLLVPGMGFRLVRISCVPLVGSSGEVDGILGITQNLTDTHEREMESRNLINGMHDTAFVMNFDAEFIEVNETAVRTLGYSRSELLSMGPVDIDTSLPVEEIKRLVRGMKTDERQVFETTHVRKDGVAIPVEICSSRLTFRGEPAILSVARDLSDRKHAEEERERLLSAVEQAGEVIFITDPQGIIQYVNPAFEKVTGYDRSEVLQRSPTMIKSGEHDREFYQNLWKTILSGQTWKGRIVNRRKDGALITMESTISPVRGADGDIVNFVAAQQDVTDGIALEEQFRQSQKLEAIGRLAGGIAHDFNNMLGVIIGRVELLLTRCEPNDQFHTGLREIRSVAKRSADLTAQLLAYARKQTIVPREFDLNRAIEDTLEMMQRLMGRGVELVWKPKAERPAVKMDPSQLDQIITNLCVNARDAVGSAGTITVETSNAAFDAEHCGSHTECIPGDFVVLTVRDNGCGMNPDVLSNLFEPFFTTKPVGEGTGLGLSTVYGIVKQNGGMVHVSSSPGKGAEFRVYLPSLKRKITTPAAIDNPIILEGGSEAILLVEDEPAVLELCREILLEVGYVVLAAETPAEALRMVDTHNPGIDLLITDVVMPNMNGRQLAERVQTLVPGIKTLYMSGYTASNLDPDQIPEGEFHFLAKPFSVSALTLKVREVIATRG